MVFLAWVQLALFLTITSMISISKVLSQCMLLLNACCTLWGVPVHLSADTTIATTNTSIVKTIYNMNLSLAWMTVQMTVEINTHTLIATGLSNHNGTARPTAWVADYMHAQRQLLI